MSIIHNNKNEKIAIFLPNLHGGGAERVMLNLAECFIKKGLDVDLVLSRAEGPYLAEVHPHVHIIDLKSDHVITSMPKLILYLRKERPHAMLSTPGHANIVALWAKFLAGVDTRVVIRSAINNSASNSNSTRFRAKLMPFFTRLFYHRASGIVAVSEGVAEDMSCFLGITREKIRVIYNPVFLSEICEMGKEFVNHPWFAPDNPPIIVTAGRLNKQKNHALLIRAFARVRRDYVARLLILGEGNERPKLESMVKSYGLEKDVFMPGFVKNPFSYMSRCNLFVLSSKFEGLPNVLIQALALGLPIVATDCPSGPKEILQNGRYGKLVPVDDEISMAKSIIDSIINRPAIDSFEDALLPFKPETITQSYLHLLIGGKIE